MLGYSFQEKEEWTEYIRMQQSEMQEEADEIKKMMYLPNQCCIYLTEEQLSRILYHVALVPNLDDVRDILQRAGENRFEWRKE